MDNSSQDTQSYEVGSATVPLSATEQGNPTNTDTGAVFVDLNGEKFKYFKPIFTKKENWQKAIDLVQATEKDYKRDRPDHIPQDKWDKLQEQRLKGLRMIANASTAKDPLFMGSESQRGKALLMDVQFQERQLSGDVEAAKQITDKALNEYRQEDEELKEALQAEYKRKQEKVLELKTKKDEKERLLTENEQKLSQIPERRKSVQDKEDALLREIKGPTNPDQATNTETQELGTYTKYSKNLENLQSVISSTERQQKGHVKRWNKEVPEKKNGNATLEEQQARLQKLIIIFREKERKAIFKGRARKSISLLDQQLQAVNDTIGAKKRYDESIDDLNKTRQNRRAIEEEATRYTQTKDQLQKEVGVLNLQYQADYNDMLATYNRMQGVDTQIRRAKQLQESRQQTA
jgi:hypothetical protein